MNDIAETVDVTTKEIVVDLHFPIQVGKGPSQRHIGRLLFRRPTLAQMREIERATASGNGMTAAAEMIRQLGADADNLSGVLTPGMVDLIDVADVMQIVEAIRPFLDLKQGSTPA